MQVLEIEINSYLNRYYSLLKNSQYFQAHEVLEELWHKLRKSNASTSSYCKGLINASIALEHLKRDRPKSKRVALKAYKSYIDRSSKSNPFGVENDNIIKEIKTLIDIRWKSLYSA